MNKKTTRISLAFLSVLMLMSYAGNSALALDRAANTTTILSESVGESTHELLLDPRFDYMSRIASGLNISALGRATCTGSFTTYDEYDSKMYVVLQQFKDGRWSDYKSWSADYTGSGIKALEEKYYVPSGYRYRVVTTAVILGNNGGELERVACDSPIKEY